MPEVRPGRGGQRETRLNCWEITRCGRQPGGDRVASLGVCPASTDAFANGLNHGLNAGRICWAVAGTFCGGEVQGTYASKRDTCMVCEVFERVRSQEEATSFQLLVRREKLEPEERSERGEVKAGPKGGPSPAGGVPPGSLARSWRDRTSRRP